jgi:hypothetical protein
MVAAGRNRAVEAVETFSQIIRLEPGDRVAFHLGEDPSPGTIEAAKAAVLEAWGPEVSVLFIAGPTVMTVVRGVEKEL